MGIQAVSVAFRKAAENFIKRSSNDIAGAVVIVSGITESKTQSFSTFDDFKKWNENEKIVTDTEVVELIRLLFVGNVTKPKAVVLEFTTYDNGAGALALHMALRKLEENGVSYFTAFVEAGQDVDVFEIESECSTYVNEHKSMFSVGRIEGDDMYSIMTCDNAEVSGCTNGGMKALITGMLAGTPITQSITNSIIDSTLITGYTDATKEELDSYVDSGVIAIFYDKGKYRVSKGVNTLQTLEEHQTEGMKKIKIASAMHMMSGDIKDILNDNYIGKMPNTYDNKCVVMAMIGEYLRGLADEDIIDDDFSVDIDIEAQKTYLKEKGVSVEDMEDDEIKEYNTDDKVFLKLRVKFVDAMEDISIVVEI